MGHQLVLGPSFDVEEYQYAHSLTQEHHLRLHEGVLELLVLPVGGRSLGGVLEFLH